MLQDAAAGSAGHPQAHALDFGIEVQISAQIAVARRWRIHEVGICYHGRMYEDGKQSNWRDGVKALGYLVRYRLFPQRQCRTCG